MRELSIAIFISTSNNTEDVFMKLFDLNFNTLKGIGLDFYIGCNKSSPELRQFVRERNLVLIDAGVESNWNDEVDAQIEILNSNYNINSFLFILDDFVISSYNKSNLGITIDYFIKNNLDYVRLKERVYLKTIFASFLKKNFIYKIKKTSNYYNSLQIALWKVDAFRTCTDRNRGKSIWEFEWLLINENWSVRKSVFHYDHVIEKGKVRQSKLQLLKKSSVSFEGERAIYFDMSILSKIKRVKFFIFGYLFSARL